MDLHKTGGANRAEGVNNNSVFSKWSEKLTITDDKVSTAQQKVLSDMKNCPISLQSIKNEADCKRAKELKEKITNLKIKAGSETSPHSYFTASLPSQVKNACEEIEKTLGSSIELYEKGKESFTSSLCDLANKQEGNTGTTPEMRIRIAKELDRFFSFIRTQKSAEEASLLDKSGDITEHHIEAIHTLLDALLPEDITLSLCENIWDLLQRFPKDTASQDASVDKKNYFEKQRGRQAGVKVNTQLKPKVENKQELQLFSLLYRTVEQKFQENNSMIFSNSFKNLWSDLQEFAKELANKTQKQVDGHLQEWDSTCLSLGGIDTQKKRLAPTPLKEPVNGWNIVLPKDELKSDTAELHHLLTEKSTQFRSNLINAETGFQGAVEYIPHTSIEFTEEEQIVREAQANTESLQGSVAVKGQSFPLFGIGEHDENVKVKLASELGQKDRKDWSDLHIEMALSRALQSSPTCSVALVIDGALWCRTSVKNKGAIAGEKSDELQEKDGVYLLKKNGTALQLTKEAGAITKTNIQKGECLVMLSGSFLRSWESFYPPLKYLYANVLKSNGPIQAAVQYLTRFVWENVCLDPIQEVLDDEKNPAPSEEIIAPSVSMVVAKYIEKS
jgi:hypothetical protein